MAIEEVDISKKNESTNGWASKRGYLKKSVYSLEFQAHCTIYLDTFLYLLMCATLYC